MTHPVSANDAVRLPVKSCRKRAFRRFHWQGNADMTNVRCLEWSQRQRNEPDDRKVTIIRTPELLILLAVLQAIPKDQLAQAKAHVFRVHSADLGGEAAHTAAHIMALLS